MKPLEYVYVPETMTYVDRRFGEHRRLAWWTDLQPRVTPWVYAPQTLYGNGEVRREGMAGQHTMPAWIGLIWAMWVDGGVLWPWFVLLIMLGAAMTRNAEVALVIAVVTFGDAAFGFYITRALISHFGYAEAIGSIAGVMAAAGALILLYRSVSRFLPAMIPNYDGEPVGRRI